MQISTGNSQNIFGRILTLFNLRIHIMAVIVSLRDFIEEMDLMSDETTVYINRETGELITLTHEEFALAEDPRGGGRHPSVAERPLAQGARGPGIGGLYPLAR